MVSTLPLTWISPPVIHRCACYALFWNILPQGRWYSNLWWMRSRQPNAIPVSKHRQRSTWFSKKKKKKKKTFTTVLLQHHAGSNIGKQDWPFMLGWRITLKQFTVSQISPQCSFVEGIQGALFPKRQQACDRFMMRCIRSSVQKSNVFSPRSNNTKIGAGIRGGFLAIQTLIVKRICQTGSGYIIFSFHTAFSRCVRGFSVVKVSMLMHIYIYIYIKGTVCFLHSVFLPINSSTIILHRQVDIHIVCSLLVDLISMESIEWCHCSSALVDIISTHGESFEALDRLERNYLW